MKKIVVCFITCAVMISVILCLITDFNLYDSGTKTLDCEKDGIIFSITAFDGKNESEAFIKCLGHAWLSIDNKTDKSIFLKDYEILPNETLTFSVWAIEKHFGVVYNLEAQFISQYGRYDGRKSISVNIEESKLEEISRLIDENNNWTMIKNCSAWSINMWNSIVESQAKVKTQTLIYTPERLQKSLNEYVCVETNHDFSRAGKVFLYEKNLRTESVLCD